MVGHDDVADQLESVPLSESHKGFEEEIAMAWITQAGKTPITTASDEMEMVQVVMTMEATRHRVILVPNVRGKTIIPPLLIPQIAHIASDVMYARLVG